MKKCIFTTLSILLIIPLYAQRFYPDSVVVIGYTHYSNATGNLSGNRVSVRDSRNWIHAIFYFKWTTNFSDSAEVYYVYSTDNGSTWSEMVNVSCTDSAVSVEATLAIDSRDYLHCTWRQYEPDSNSFDLYYSTYNGTLWTVPKNISQQYSSDNLGHYSSMVVDSRDYIHVVWDLSTAPGDWDIFYSFYNDTVWSVPYQVSTSPYDDAFPALAIDHNDDLHLVWRKRVTDGPIMYTRYDGVSWTTPEIIATIPGGNSYSSCIVVNSQGYPRVTWQGGLPTDSGNVYYTDYNGVLWSKPLNLSNTIRASNHNSLAIDSLDNLYVVWQEKTTFPDYEIYYRTYNGITWSEVMNISQDTLLSCCPKLGGSVKGDKIDLIWTSYALPALEVLYLGLNPVGIVEERSVGVKQKTLMLTVSPNPFSKKTDIRYQITDSRLQQLKIYDSSSRLVRQWDYTTIRQSDQIVWDGLDDFSQQVPAGVYFIKLETPHYKETQKVILLK